jgi:Bacterial protein of unknown function (DUF839)
VEIDPENSRAIAHKHARLGRFKHEGANLIITDNGKARAPSVDCPDVPERCRPQLARRPKTGRWHPPGRRVPPAFF